MAGLTGPSGTIKCGYAVVAAMGRWSLETSVARKGQPDTHTIRATVKVVDGYLARHGQHYSVVLELAGQAGRMVWDNAVVVFRDRTVMVTAQGDEAYEAVKIRPAGVGAPMPLWGGSLDDPECEWIEVKNQLTYGEVQRLAGALVDGITVPESVTRDERALGQYKESLRIKLDLTYDDPYKVLHLLNQGRFLDLQVPRPVTVWMPTLLP